MWKSKRSKSKIFPKIKALIIGVIFVLGILSIFFLIFNLTGKKTSYISPIPLYRHSQKSVSSNDVFLGNLKNLLALKNISFSSISISTDSAYLVKLSSDEEVIFSSKHNLDMQVSSLQLILSRLTIEGKKFIKLDFRFDKPIIILK